MKKCTLLSLLFLLHVFPLYAGKVEKGFRALDIYNYFEAKQLFEKALKRDEVAASYGLSIIYSRNDNPFFNLDTAHKFVVTAHDHYPNLVPKKKEKYEELNITSKALFQHRKRVTGLLYQRARAVHSEASYQVFIDRNPWSEDLDSAIYLRDEIAFGNARAEETAAAFDRFLKKYPNSVFAEEATGFFERLRYQEETRDNNFIDYVSFIATYPDSPYRGDAEDKVYQIYTKTGSMESYKGFIDTYPKNRNVPIAWKKLFNTYLEDNYSGNSIQSFLKEFEDYPFKEELEAQLAIADLKLYPIKDRNKWGYIDAKGDYYIKPQFDGGEEFYEGLAIVALDGKYGFIDKTGQMAIPAIFDDAFEMNEGHAVVEIDEKWGMINRSGEFVVQPEYDDLGNLNEGLAYFAKDEAYGYFDEKGIVRLKEQYTGADDFENGKAIVSKNDLYGVIDRFGTTFIPFKYEDLKTYLPGIYAVQLDDLWGLITLEGDTLLPFEYDFIGDMKDNRAIVEKDYLFNYIDLKGQPLLTEWIETYREFRQLAEFRNGYAKIEFEKGFNLIDTNGRLFSKKYFDEMGAYGDLVAVGKKDKWGYVGKNGVLVLNYNFSSAASFQGEYAFAGGAPLVGLIGKDGKYRIEPYFEKMTFFNDSLIITKSRGSYGILTVTGDTLLNFQYLSIEPYGTSVVQIKTSEAIFYYDVRQNTFIRKEEE